MAKMRVVGVARSIEDSTMPFALKIEFSMGVVTQPCTTEEFLRALNEMLEHNEVTIEVAVTR